MEHVVTRLFCFFLLMQGMIACSIATQCITRITKTGSRQYLQLVESYRNNACKVRVRVIANLGRLDRLGPEQLDALINGLNRAIGRA